MLESTSSYSKASDAAYRLAESGVNNAMAPLGYSNTNALSTTALQPDEASASSQSYSTGTAKWWGTLNTSTKVWTIYGKGFVNSPTGAGSQVTRQVSATMQVTIALIDRVRSPTMTSPKPAIMTMVRTLM